MVSIVSKILNVLLILSAIIYTCWYNSIKGDDAVMDNKNTVTPEKDSHESLYQSIFDVDCIMNSAELMDQGNEVHEEVQRILWKNRRSIIVVTFLLVVCFFISFCVGRYAVSLSGVFTAIGNGLRHTVWYIGKICGNTATEPEWLVTSEDTVIWLVRMPRILAAMLVGSALSFSGATYQSLFRNPMVSPDILGASSGASVGACLMMLFSKNNTFIQFGAFGMGILAVALSYLLSKAISVNGNTVLILVLCGMTVNTLFQAFVSIIKYLADPESQLPEMTYWLMGSIAKIDFEDLRFFIVTFALGVVPVYLLRWKINILSLSEDEAKSMGVNISCTRLICVICATLLTASVVSFAGTVGWVGLMIPHLVRFIVGANNRILLPMSLLTGALFMLIIDNVCRTLFPYEIPLGVLTSLLGAPFFIYILYKRKGSA